MKLAQRLGAALGFAPLILLSIFYQEPIFFSGFYFFFLFPLFLVIFGGWELNNLLSGSAAPPFRLLYLIIALVAVCGTFGPLGEELPHRTNWSGAVTPAEWFFLMAMTGLLLMTARRLGAVKIAGSLEECGQGLFFLFALAAPAGFLTLIFRRPGGSWLILFLYLVSWLIDTGGYAIGPWLGKRKLSPMISPKKTIAGFWGGVLFGVSTALIMKAVLGATLPLTYAEALFSGVFLAMAAQVGDLVESLLKRQMQTKDSGSIIPGHGGILDIFDGILYSAPLFYLYVAVFT